jgi:hypothetical protein
MGTSARACANEQQAAERHERDATGYADLNREDDVAPHVGHRPRLDSRAVIADLHVRCSDQALIRWRRRISAPGGGYIAVGKASGTNTTSVP